MASLVLGLYTHFWELRPSAGPVKGIFQIQNRLESQESYLIEVMDISHTNHFKYQIYLSKKKKLPVLTIGTCLQISGEIQTKPRLWNLSNLLLPQKPRISVYNLKAIGSKDNYLNHFQENLVMARSGIEDYLTKLTSTKVKALLLALLFGDRHHLSSQLINDFKTYGMIHLLSISGLHILSLYQAIFFLSQKLTLPRYISGVFSLSLTLAYLILIGVPLSGLRAFVMLVMKEIANLLGREYDAYTALAISSLILQLYDSQSLYQPGVWLSLLATLGLITLPKPCQKHFTSFFQVLFCNLWTLPVIAFLQGEVHLLTLVFNLLLTPLILLCFYVGWMSLFLSFIYKGMAQFSLSVVEVVLIIIENVFSYFTQFSYGYILLGRRQFWLLGIYYLLLISLIIYLNKGEKS